MKFAIIMLFTSAVVFAGEITIEATGENPNERHQSVTPELIELLVDIDPKAYGYLAQAHHMQMTLSFDPIINGRLSGDYAVKLSPRFKLLFPFSLEHNALQATAWKTNDRIESEWAALGGVGTKFRLSEWMQKSSFYIELWLQTGLYSQQAKGFDNRYALALRPSAYVGWERIFESGLVVGAKVGAEYDYHLPTGAPFAYLGNNFNFIPAISVGFAW